ncbi:MAG: type IV toxin-antitoxin system AbiEi family antitoxin domain-containing protein [Coriobacteriia bacterium]|nr:type IV toxin-antitoxin system AbiEi family antitoxin domain-containing protein [Coriobacteriia bacterium]
MNHAKIIREKMKNTGGIITAKDLRASHIPSVYLTRMVEKGKLIRADRGIYLDSTGDYDEYYFFQTKYSVAIFSYVSALFLHGLTDIIPNELEVTVYKGYNPHRIKDKARIHYVTRNIYELGLTESKTAFGNHVKVYDVERTICDMIKNRNKIEVELFSKTMHRYIQSPKKDLHKLYEYASEMKVYQKVKDIIELVYV